MGIILQVIRAFLPEMIKNKEGRIVLMSSSSGIHALAHGNVYSATKFALLGQIAFLILTRKLVIQKLILFAFFRHNLFSVRRIPI